MKVEKNTIAENDVENIVKEIKWLYLQLKECDFEWKLQQISIVFVKEIKVGFSFTFCMCYWKFWRNS